MNFLMKNKKNFGINKIIVIFRRKQKNKSKKIQCSCLLFRAGKPGCIGVAGSLASVGEKGCPCLFNYILQFHMLLLEYEESSHLSFPRLGHGSNANDVLRILKLKNNKLI